MLLSQGVDNSRLERSNANTPFTHSGEPSLLKTATGVNQKSSEGIFPYD